MYNIKERFFENPVEYLIYESNIEREDLLLYSNDYQLEGFICELQPMQKVDADTFVDCIDEDRFDEERVQEDKLLELFNKYCDFEAINKEMPKLWYPTGKKIIWSKEELLELWK